MLGFRGRVRRAVPGLRLDGHRRRRRALPRREEPRSLGWARRRHRRFISCVYVVGNGGLLPLTRRAAAAVLARVLAVAAVGRRGSCGRGRPPRIRSPRPSPRGRRTTRAPPAPRLSAAARAGRPLTRAAARAADGLARGDGVGPRREPNAGPGASARARGRRARGRHLTYRARKNRPARPRRASPTGRSRRADPRRRRRAGRAGTRPRRGPSWVASEDAAGPRGDPGCARDGLARGVARRAASGPRDDPGGRGVFRAGARGGLVRAPRGRSVDAGRRAGRGARGGGRPGRRRGHRGAAGRPPARARDRGARGR